MKLETYHDLILEEFERRKLVNESYSLRAFARDLGLSAPRLNQVLAKKQGLSVKAAKELAEKLNLTTTEQEWFCNSVGSFHARGFKERQAYQEKIAEYKKTASSFTSLQLEYFKIISDWHHFAILELTYLENFEYRIEWIANTLKISENEVSSAIDRLKSLELAEEENGTLVDKFKFLATPNDTPSKSLKKFNTQLMKKAMEALYEQPILDREMSSNIFAISKSDIPKFKKTLRSFRRNMERDASQADKKDAVYCLGIQFYQLDRSSQ